MIEPAGMTLPAFGDSGAFRDAVLLPSVSATITA